MDNSGNMVMLCCQDHRNRNKAAFGKEYVRFIFFNELPCLSVSFQDAEGIGKVFKIEITAQLSRRNTIIGNPCVFDQLSFDPIVGANIADKMLARKKQLESKGNGSGIRPPSGKGSEPDLG